MVYISLTITLLKAFVLNRHKIVSLDGFFSSIHAIVLRVLWDQIFHRNNFFYMYGFCIILQS